MNGDLNVSDVAKGSIVAVLYITTGKHTRANSLLHYWMWTFISSAKGNFLDMVGALKWDFLCFVIQRWKLIDWWLFDSTNTFQNVFNLLYFKYASLFSLFGQVDLSFHSYRLCSKYWVRNLAVEVSLWVLSSIDALINNCGNLSYLRIELFLPLRFAEVFNKFEKCRKRLLNLFRYAVCGHKCRPGVSYLNYVYI